MIETPPAAKKITLRDGRRLGFTEFGDLSGRPVINCHGGLVNRMDVMWADAAAKKARVRLISPDRPGVASSDRCRTRLLVDWPSDVVELADALHLEKFSILGWSMGGQYALACGNALPKRVKHIAVIAGCLELSKRKNFDHLNPMDKDFSRLTHHLPPIAWATYWMLGKIARHLPNYWVKASSRHLSSRDKQIIAAEPKKNFVLPMAQALATPRGMLDEYRVFVEPWGFDPTTIVVPVSVWQGTDDTLVPASWAKHLAKQLPSARLHMVAGQGHFLAHDHISGILAELR